MIFGFSFLLTGEAKANSCEDSGPAYYCKANDCDSYGMDPVMSGAFTCGADNASMICCKPRPATTTTTTTGVQDYCVNLADGASCLTFNNEPGTCKNKTCVATSTTTSTATSTTTSTTSSSGGGWNSSSLRAFNLPEAPLYYIITNILNWLLTIVGVIAIITLVISGLQYFLVATDEKMMESAKKTMKAAIIGLIVAISGVVVIFSVERILTAQMFF